jgi:uncharacterized membrane protein YbhN (UPF0104 family)
MDVVIAAGLLLSTISFAVKLDWLRPIAIVLMVFVILLISSMFLVAGNAGKIEIWLSNHHFKSEFIDKTIKPLIIKGVHGLKTLAKPRNLVKAVFWILLSWVIWVSLLFYAIRIMASHAPLWWAIFAEGVLALGIALPSAPASLGVYEGTMVVALSVLGIEKNAALSTAIVLHSIQIAITSVIGIMGLSLHGITIVEIINTISIRRKKKTEKRVING